MEKKCRALRQSLSERKTSEADLLKELDEEQRAHSKTLAENKQLQREIKVWVWEGETHSPPQPQTYPRPHPPRNPAPAVGAAGCTWTARRARRRG